MRDVGEERESRTRVTGNLQQVCLQALQVWVPHRREKRTKDEGEESDPVDHQNVDFEASRGSGSSRGRFWLILGSLLDVILDTFCTFSRLRCSMCPLTLNFAFERRFLSPKGSPSDVNVGKVCL